jgi:glycosyltransferase involved in cell wall biosynthesis
MREKLSVLLPTYNNAALLPALFAAYAWADEIVVVDSFSTDNTLALAQAHGVRVLQRRYDQSANQKNWAIPQCAHAWILQVDTDELPEPGLREEIEQLLLTPSADIHGYRIPFKHHILGQWVRVMNLYPEYHLRLFRKATGRFEDKEVHAHVQTPGTVGALRHHLLHYGMPTLSKQLSNLDRYSRYQADELRKRGKRFHWTHVVFRPLAVFAYYFFYKRGFTAGYRGFFLSAHNALFDFWAHAKLWELEELGLPASPP